MGGILYRELVHELASLPTSIVNLPVPIIGSRKTLVSPTHTTLGTVLLHSRIRTGIIDGGKKCNLKNASSLSPILNIQLFSIQNYSFPLIL